MKDFSTLAELIPYQASRFCNPHAFNFKEKGELKSFSNQEFLEKAFHFACGLHELGLHKHQTLANFSYQNPIWLIADLGAILAGAVTVPIFHNISQENLAYEIRDANVKFVFTDNHEFFKLIKDEKFDLKIITYGFKKENSISFEELISLGEKAVSEKKYYLDDFLKKIKPEDLATIIYTSGSTGRPKGVELTHENLVSQIKATAEVFPLTQKDVALSFLPLAHIFERMVMMFYMTQGITIYFADDVKNVGNLLREFRPTLMTTVPRLLEKVYGKIREGAQNSSFIKKFLAQSAICRANCAHQKNLLDKIYDALVYKKFRAALGGNMQMIICGGASLSENLERFYRNIGLNLYCGYGLTETSPVLAVNHAKAHRLGTVGKAFPGVELKISAEGELLARGPNIMRGYHKQPEKTAEVMEKGWFKTGDRAVIEDGFLKIIGRKKELFKTANGKYVSPLPIEHKLVQEIPGLLGAIVIAEGKKFVSALLFPDGVEVSEKIAAEKIAQINKGLNHWEQIQKFKIITQPISIESGEITPSMKLKRNVLEEKFKKEIEEFYAE